MRSIFTSAAYAVVPVAATVAAISTVRAADVPFPAVLSVSAWPHWLVLISLVFTFTSSGYWLLARLPSKQAPAAPSGDKAA
jgi:hypothetical protein